MALQDVLQSLRDIDLSDIDVNDLDFSSAGQWSAPVKGLTSLFGFSIVLAAGYFFLITDMQAEFKTAKNQEQILRESFEIKYQQAGLLEDYRQQAKEMEEKFESILRQLPSDTEIPGLIEDITEVGIKNGLIFNQIDLQEEEQLEFYVEKPINIEVTGGYHELGAFVSDVSDLPRIVTLHDFEITRKGGSSSGAENRGGLLTMKITAKTYRYSVERE
ncbi:MAG: type 4a pilus biogenesis protein PilO [Gammaproteobacteria bacterium]|jgi:type IV pilus assembly protein PilO|nr:type 4a pilus biogenesis protein PilO [Gammaproteobacteria bacterium]MBT5205414.1 type 4a pilus biogenesis protein PilO [Gammaproteobacteria bacterium]MBT5604129.1 type 4a pilus biogenesis protein PilO [Gammaproteobacteria bacterium]MBT6245724.1 type 4a pilus biogenesis protein PilO [Gammaproteobacteria bacterium]